MHDNAGHKIPGYWIAACMACRLTPLTYDENECTVNDFTDLQNLPLDRWWYEDDESEDDTAPDNLVIAKTRAIPLDIDVEIMHGEWDPNEIRDQYFFVNFDWLDLDKMLKPLYNGPRHSSVVRVAFVFLCGLIEDDLEIKRNIRSLLLDRVYESNFDWLRSVKVLTSPHVLCIKMDSHEIADSVAAMPPLRPHAEMEGEELPTGHWPYMHPSKYVWERLSDLTPET